MAKFDYLSDEQKVIFNWVRRENTWQTTRNGGKDFKLALEFDGADLLIYPVAHAAFYKLDELATLANAMHFHSFAQAQPFGDHFKVTFRSYK